MLLEALKHEIKNIFTKMALSDHNTVLKLNEIVNHLPSEAPRHQTAPQPQPKINLT